MLKLAPKDAAREAPADGPLPSGPGWAAVPPGAGERLPAVGGRFCWNPLFGDMLELESKGAGPFLLERFKDFGPVFSWQLGPTRVVSVLDYDTIRSLLQHDGRVVQGWNPESLYAMLGEASRANFENAETRMGVRKLLAPGFSHGALGGYLDKMVSIVHDQLDEWVATGPIDLARDGKAMSFEFSTQLLVDFAVPKERKQELRAKFDRLFTGMMSPAIRLPGTRFTAGLQARKELIGDVKALLRDSGRHKGQGGGADGKASVFEYMVEARKYSLHSETLSDDEMAASGISLIIAGNDTSGLGITAALGLLPLLPDVVRRLREEQAQVVAAHGPGITRAALDAMPYSEAVVKEVLRLVPPATGVFRRTLVDMELAGRYFVPAGTILNLGIFLAQLLTDPRLQPAVPGAPTPALDAAAKAQQWLSHLPADYFATINPATLEREFRPEHWLPAPPAGAAAAAAAVQADAAAPARPSGLLTFGAGPHVCLGQGLFMLEAKVLLAALARHYTLELLEPEQYSVKVGFIPQTRKGTMLRVGRLEAAA